MEPNSPADGLGLCRRTMLATVSLLVGAAVWMPLVHLVFRPGREQLRSGSGVAPLARQLARRHMELWQQPAALAEHGDIERMRTNNPEWDFMGRTYLVLSLANMCLREPEHRGDCLAVMDRVIGDTQAMVKNRGITHFLMDYARGGEFMQQPARSIFVDGELALMLGARRLIAESEACRDRMIELADLTARRMSEGPALSCESYPNECWSFCNAVALAAIRIHEVLDGSDHSSLLRGWIEMARRKLVDPGTGLLCSSYSYDGGVGDGPEGSSIWMVAHCLQLVDEPFAIDQYARARRHLRHACLGFGWAGEWPATRRGAMDVDSGPVIPVLDVSAGSSGLAFLGAGAFDDTGYYAELATTVLFAGFPQRRGEALRFCASNQVGDAVLLYSAVVGPLWKEVQARAAATRLPASRAEAMP